MIIRLLMLLLNAHDHHDSIIAINSIMFCLITQFVIIIICNHQVLIYNGQLDVIIGHSLTQVPHCEPQHYRHVITLVIIISAIIKVINHHHLCLR